MVGTKYSLQVPSLGMCFNSRSIVRRSSGSLHDVKGGSTEQGVEFQSKLLSNSYSSKKEGMIHYSSMEGFLSPPRRGLLPFEAEDFVNLAELDRRLRFTPMVGKSFGFQVEEGKEEDKGEKRKIRKEIILFPFII